MSETEIRRSIKESEPEALDISEQVREIIESDDLYKPIKLQDLLRQPQYKNAPALKLTLPFYDDNWAKWCKSFVGDNRASEKGQERYASIIATESQKNKNANVFDSEVKWINSEEVSSGASSTPGSVSA